MKDRRGAQKQALSAARAGRWEEVQALLSGWAEESGDPWLINDLAIARHQSGDTLGPVTLLESLGPEEALPSGVRLNRFYLRRVHELLADFDPCWQRTEIGQENGPAVLVSVIVRTYNRPHLLAEALASLRAQTFSDFEVIVVNDGGVPAAEEVVKKSGLTRVRYLMLPHAGRVRALNAGLAAARGKYITALDDDDVVYPEHLERLTTYLELPGAAAVVYADYRLVSYRCTPEGRLVRARQREVRAGPYYRGILFTTNPCTILLMARRECYEKVGRFMEGLELAEDWEMWLRLAERYDFHHLPVITAEVRERPGDANLTFRRLEQKYYWDNIVLYLHRGLFLLSEPKEPELAAGYARALAFLDRFLGAHPETLPLLNLRGLWEMRKPYAWFADQGRWFLQLEKPELAAVMYEMAARLAPFEPKVWGGWAGAAVKRWWPGLRRGG